MDIGRLALQAAVAGAAAYLAIGWIGTGESFLAVISAVLVLQTDREATLQSAGSRIVGTVIGTIVGGIALAVGGNGAVPYPLAGAMLIMGGLAAYKPQWRYGIVAAAGLAVHSDSGFWETAVNRGTAIFVGSAIGMAAGLLVLPESARARARRQMGEALSLCRELLDTTLSSAIDDGSEARDELHSRFARAISNARDTAGSIKLLKDKGKLYRLAVHRIERLWHALIILDRANESRSGGSLPLRDETIGHIRKIQSSTCDALQHAERFERVPPDDLEKLQNACREVWQDADVHPDNDDELQAVGLVFGLHEISRNIAEIDQSICAIGDAG